MRYRLILSPVTIGNQDPFHTLRWRLFQFNNFHLESIDRPHVFYIFNFISHPLPLPSRNSFKFNILFTLRIKSRWILAVQLAQFITSVSADVQSVSSSIKLWDLTFQVDQNHIFSCLQFKTRDRHEIIQMKGHFYTMTIVTTNPTTNKTTFYYEFSGFLLSDHAVSTYVRQINNGLRYV